MLSVKAIEALRPRQKPYKIFDSGGLFLQVTPAGAKLWRMKFTIDGREKLLSFGKFPLVSLADARQKRDDARRLLLADKDPAMERKKAKVAAVANRSTTFELVCRDWHATNKDRWSATHAREVLASLESEIFPAIGQMPVADLTTAALLGALRPIAQRGAVETAHRIRQRVEAALDFAVANGTEIENIGRRVKGALPAVIRMGKQPAIVQLDDIRELLTRVESEPAHITTKLANRLLALTAVRPGTLRTTRWRDREFHDLEGQNPRWHIPAQRMKLSVERRTDSGFDLIVPLAPAAVNVILTMREISGRCEYVFPGVRNSKRPISENAVNYMLGRAGYHGLHTSHGWRSSFSTIMNEVCERNGTKAADSPIIDLMLGHLPPNKVEAAYNRSQFFPRRRELASEWACLLMADRCSASALLDLPRR